MTSKIIQKTIQKPSKTSHYSVLSPVCLTYALGTVSRHMSPIPPFTNLALSPVSLIYTLEIMSLLWKNMSDVCQKLCQNQITGTSLAYLNFGNYEPSLEKHV